MKSIGVTSAIGLNAGLNGVTLTTTIADLLGQPPPRAVTILAGDLFYEKTTAARAFAWLTRAAGQGCHVLIGDPGRCYLPREALDEIAAYQVPVTRDLEDALIKRSAVWRLASPSLDSPAPG